MKNKYIKVAHISEEKFRQVLKLFCASIEARQVAEILSLNRNTINRFFCLFRKRIAALCRAESVLGEGAIEIDESYFGAKRVRGNRGRGASGKIPVFGMLERSGKVYTQIVKNCSASELIPIILEQAKIGSTMFSDCWKSYNGLVDFGYKKHYRVKHGEGQYAQKELEIIEEKEVEIKNHINGIENFWGLCKVRLARFRGIKKDNFLLHLKECEFRYNNRDQDLYKILLRNFRKMPLN